jgi:hypothetical protein
MTLCGLYCITRGGCGLCCVTTAGCGLCCVTGGGCGLCCVTTDCMTKYLVAEGEEGGEEARYRRAAS